MKVSEVTVKDIANFLKVDEADSEASRDISIILVAAKAYIKSYTGLTSEILDLKEDVTIALMVLCNEMYENRLFTVRDDKVNTVIKSILDMHCVNML